MRSEVLMHLERADTALQRLLERTGPRGRAPPEEAHVDGPGVEGRVGGPETPCRVDAHAPERAELLAEDARDAGCEGGLADARRQQVDVGVNRAGRRDQALPGDDDGAGADDDVDVVGGVRVAGAAHSDRSDPHGFRCWH